MSRRCGLKLPNICEALGKLSYYKSPLRRKLVFWAAEKKVEPRLPARVHDLVGCTLTGAYRAFH